MFQSLAATFSPLLNIVKENDGRCTAILDRNPLYSARTTRTGDVALLPYEEDQRDVLAHDAHVLVAELLAYNPVVRVVKEHNLLADRGVRRVMATAQNRMERKRLRGTLRILLYVINTSEEGRLQRKAWMAHWRD